MYDSAVSAEVKERLQRLRPDSQRQWGKMGPAQMLAHCSASIEMALGDERPPRMMIGRILGPVAKRFTLRDEKPMVRNAQTAKCLLVQDGKDFEPERARLALLIDRFAAAGPSGCTSHPHFLFGTLTPEEWSRLVYKHLDHHLRQFGV